ncbi:MAG: EamA family transporter [Paracoccaceae bacterium]|mgnify:FL=1|nr:EamA family transporter [Paracoccaceae bacterium]
MSEWFLAIEGTQTGANLALFLAILAAVLHALFGTLQKGRHDPWISRGAIDICYALMAAPFALFVVPWPEPHMWPIFAIAWIIHTIYKVLQAAAYTFGSFTVVYPVVRGSSPFFAVIAAFFVFGEALNAIQIAGVTMLVLGIFGLALYNFIHIQIDRDTLVLATVFALCTGVTVAAYTTFDAYGIRATFNPFTFLAWFFLIDGFAIPAYAALRIWKMETRPAFKPLFARGIMGAFIAYFSFGSILMATRLDNVGEAAVLRETSVVFAAFFGWLILKEKVGPRRLILMVLIALGAVIMEIGG